VPGRQGGGGARALAANAPCPACSKRGLLHLLGARLMCLLPGLTVMHHSVVCVPMGIVQLGWGGSGAGGVAAATTVAGAAAAPGCPLAGGRRQQPAAVRILLCRRTRVVAGVARVQAAERQRRTGRSRRRYLRAMVGTAAAAAARSSCHGQQRRPCHVPRPSDPSTRRKHGRREAESARDRDHGLPGRGEDDVGQPHPARCCCGAACVTRGVPAPI